jgi:glyoxylase-like metal-dependent hydrolase (beta-lactamase superfamily II)
MHDAAFSPESKRHQGDFAMTDTQKLDRRALMTGAAITGAALTVGVSDLSLAAAPKQGVSRPSVYRFGLGDFEVTTILDGVFQLDGPHPIFGQNVTQEEVAALAVANFLPPDRMEIPFTVTVVNTGAALVLFDSGNGARRRPNAGRLRELLDSAGFTPEQVDIVALTHFHGDHIGGLMEDGSPAFPNATYVIGDKEYDYWSDEDLLLDDKMVGRAQLVQNNVVPFAPKTRFIKGGDAVVSGIEAVASHGHTPGHTSYHLESQGKRLLVLGDVCNHYVVSLQRPDWHVRFDMDKEKAVAARKEVLGMIAADRIPFVGYHMPPPAVGYLETKGEGFRFVPVGYQLNL